MIPKAVLVYHKEFLAEDKNLLKLVRFFGIECPVFSTDDWLAHLKGSKVDPNEICLFASADTLINLVQSPGAAVNLAIEIIEHLHSLFVYALSPAESISRLLQQLTQNRVQSISELQDSNYTYDINPNFKEINGPFAGLQMGQINRDIDFVFEVNPAHKLNECLITINKTPFFLKIPRGKCNLFLIACKRVLDIEHKVNSNLDVRAYFSQIVPLVMFLKYTFQKMCWTVNKHYASFIVDDPLLRSTYGFMNNEKLIKTMESSRFSTTIAFIPWNYRRSNMVDSKVFWENREKYSLCVHGCDHTWGEFASTDCIDLNNRINLAKRRMQINEQKTTLRFDNVMVFPQGLFSTRAIKMLKLNNFSGAVNTSIVPLDYDRDGIQISNLLEPAIMKFHSFPLFTRRYPSGGIENFAFDILLGKPCFIVVHHDFFKEGYENLAQFVDNINSLEDLQWGGLGNAISGCSLYKIDSNGNALIKMYGNRLILNNLNEDSRKYTVIKEENSSSFSGIKINEKSIDYKLDGTTLEFQVEIFPGEELVIDTIYKNDFPKTFLNYPLHYHMKTAATRYLSEIRDNFLSKNEAVLKFALQLKKVFLFR